MAETLATLAFLSAVAMLLSPLFEKGKWLASITATFCTLSFVTSPFETIHQPGGSVLVIVAMMCILLQYHITQGYPKKYFNGMGGAMTLVLLLTLYPMDGISSTIHEYSLFSGIQELLQSLVIGTVLAQLLFNSISFNKTHSLIIIGVLTILLLSSDLLLSGELLVVIISMCFIGLIPYLEQKISPKITNRGGRATALAISTLIGIILVFAITYASVSNVPRIGTGHGSIAVALWLTVAVTAIGLCGMLLPLLGFDAHPRPEAWGWRLGLAVSPMVLCLQTDLAGHVSLGILLALLISISSPLVLEKGKTKAA